MKSPEYTNTGTKELSTKELSALQMQKFSSRCLNPYLNVGRSSQHMRGHISNS